MPKLEDLDLYMNDNDCIKGKSKDGQVYVLSYETGELTLAEKSIDIMWGGCPLDYAKEVQAKIKAGI